MSRGIKQLSEDDITSLKIAIQRSVQWGMTQTEIAVVMNIKRATVVTIEPLGSMNN